MMDNIFKIFVTFVPSWFKFAFTIFTLIMIAPAQADSAQTSTTHTLQYDGLERTYHLYIPASYDESETAPLLIAVHTHVSSGKAIEAISGFNDIADEQGYIVAYPDSYWAYWDDGRSVAGIPPAEDFVDDVGFLEALIVDLEENHNIDSERVYLTGLGNGGLLVYRAACEMPQRFAGVAVVSALLWSYHPEACPETAAAPLNMLIIHGTDDIKHPPNADPTDNIETLSRQSTWNFWFERNTCDSDSVEETDEFSLAAGCADDTKLALYSVDGGGSNWPQTGDYQVDLYGVDATQLIASFFAGDEEWDVPPVQVETDYVGPPRTYRIYVPQSYTPDEAMPLVVMLHGAGGTGLNMSYMTGMSSIADEENFIVAYPDGIALNWDFSPSPTQIGGSVDAEYLKKMVDDIAVDLNIDKQRVYAAGYSNGGHMALLLACQAQDTFAAIASASATLSTGMLRLCTEAQPIPIITMHGTLDSIIPWNGVRDRGVYSATDTVSFWLGRNLCDVENVFEEELPQLGYSPQTQVRHFIFDCSATNTGVQFYAVVNGGHNWPGIAGEIPEGIAGDYNMDFNASQVIWDFFALYTLDRE
jgi:poly(3-hydroxybutyrate) depolymerase